jgi:acetyltransferase
MTIRNLDALFAPKSVALIGASRRPQSVGAVVARNLFHGGFAGPILPVNPNATAIEGALAYSDVDHLPIAPDLAVIGTPPETIPELIDKLGRRGTRGAVILSAGFGEMGEEGKRLQQAVLDAAKPHLMRIIGPNCLGIAVPGVGLNASFAPGMPQTGEIALVAQSGAVVTTVLDWARGHDIGFSHLISLGDMADVDFGDMLDYLAEAPHVRAILLYVEAITHARKFMSAARRAARIKPVIVLKAGRKPEGAKAASSHTGAMAGADDVADAAFRRAGMLRVYELAELFAAVETLAAGIAVTGDRLAIITNGGGVGVMATDSLIEQGGRLAQLSDVTLSNLDRNLPRTWSKSNPVDIIGDAPGARYAAALEAVSADENVDGILVLNCPTAISDSLEAAHAVVDTAAKPRQPGPRLRAKPPILSAWLGGPAALESRRYFADHRIPAYETPERAVQAFMHLVRYRKNQELLREAPPGLASGFVAGRERVQAIIAEAKAQGRVWLSEPEAKAVLDAYDIPVALTLIARDAAEVEAAATSIFDKGATSLAIKIISDDITHKSDVGGVILDIESASDAKRAAEAMGRRIQAAMPQARLSGFSVQEMISRPDAVETIVGMATDPTFGPVILFGAGGTKVELLADKAVGLVPLNVTLADDLIAHTRIAKLFEAHRGKPAADKAALALALVKISQLVIDTPEIAEIDINPLLVDSSGVIALDGRVRLNSDGVLTAPAIRPYPQELEDKLITPAGREYTLRPIRPEDAPMLQAMMEKVTPEDSRLRFFSPLRELPPLMAARLCQIDYDREMALVALEPCTQDGQAVAGVVRITADPDNDRAEYAVLVRSDLKGVGLGWKLMKRILAIAKARGIGEVYGHVLRDNATMISMARELGFTIEALPDDPGIVQVHCHLANYSVGGDD